MTALGSESRADRWGERGEGDGGSGRPWRAGRRTCSLPARRARCRAAHSRGQLRADARPVGAVVDGDREAVIVALGHPLVRSAAAACRGNKAPCQVTVGAAGCPCCWFCCCLHVELPLCLLGWVETKRGKEYRGLEGLMSWPASRLLPHARGLGERARPGDGQAQTPQKSGCKCVGKPSGCLWVSKVEQRYSLMGLRWGMQWAPAVGAAGALGR